MWLEELLTAKQTFDEKEDVHFKTAPVPTRRQINGMWQLLLEEGAIAHSKKIQILLCFFNSFNFFFEKQRFL